MPHYNPQKPFGNNFKPDNDTQAGFFDLFAEYATAEPALTSEQLLEGICETMYATHFVHPDIVKKLPVYQKVEGFFKRYNISAPVTQKSGKLLPRRLICRIWNSAKYASDRARALELYDRIRNGCYTVLAPPAAGAQNVSRTRGRSASHGASGKADRLSRPVSRNLAKAITTRLSSEASKPGKRAKQQWDRYLDSYARSSLEMDLTNDVNKVNSHHVPRSHALDFYREVNAGKANTWGEVLRMVDEGINTNLRMEAVWDRLRRLHISQYESEDCTEEGALQALGRDIQLLSLQVPLECRTDRH